MTEVFAFVDWLPLPSRVTPAAREQERQRRSRGRQSTRNPNGEAEPVLLTLSTATRQGIAVSDLKSTDGENPLRKPFKSFKAKVSGITGGAANSDELLEVTKLEERILDAMLDWLSGAGPEKAISFAVEHAGLVAVAIEVESVQTGPASRLDLRKQVNPDEIALLAVHLVRITLSEGAGQSESLRMLDPGSEIGYFEVDALLARPVPVDPASPGLKAATTRQVSNSPNVDDSTAKLCRALLRTRELFDARVEPHSPGGAPVPNPSPEAFVSLSTRYGALIDSTLPALSDPNRFSNTEQNAASAFASNYSRGAFLLFASFCMLVIVPNLPWIKILVSGKSHGLTQSGYAVFFFLFAVLSLLACLGTVEAKLALKKSTALPLWSLESVVPKKSDQTLIRLLQYLVDFIVALWSYGREVLTFSSLAVLVRDGFLYAATALLVAVWFVLFFQLYPLPHEPDLVPGSTSLVESLRKVLWGLPVIGIGLLKIGYDNVRDFVVETFGRERRLEMLTGLEQSLVMGQRFSTNINLAFAKAARSGNIKSSLNRLLTLQHAKDDVSNAKRVLTSEIEGAKAGILRTAAVTGTLVFLVTQLDPIGALEPKTESTPVPKPMIDAAVDMGRRNLASMTEALDGRPMSRSLGILFGEKSCLVSSEGKGAERRECNSDEQRVYLNTVAAGLITDLGSKLDGPRSESPSADELLDAVFSRISGKDGANLKRIEDRSRELIEGAVAAGIEGVIRKCAEGISRGENSAGPGSGLCGNFNGLTMEAALSKSIANLNVEFDPKLHYPLKTFIHKLIVSALQEQIDTVDMSRNTELTKFFKGAIQRALTAEIGEDVKHDQIRDFFFGALTDALEREYRVKLDTKPLQEGEITNISAELRKVVVKMLHNTEQIECPLGDGKIEKVSLSNCFARIVAFNMPQPSWIEDVPGNCKENGDLMGRIYFLKPPSADPDLKCPGEEPARLRRCYFKEGPPERLPHDQLAGYLQTHEDPAKREVSNACKDSCDRGETLSGDLAAMSARIRDKVKATTQPYQIVVVGYADSAGTPVTNLVIANNRANNIKDEIKTYLGELPLTYSAIGRGEEVQSTVYGRNIAVETAISRRADVWLCPLGKN